MIFVPELTGIVDVRVVKYEISGNPSCVIRAQLKFLYSDGQIVEYFADYEPDGIIFESFQLSLEALRKRLNIMRKNKEVK